jgi:hypothetical protein
VDADQEFHREMEEEEMQANRESHAADLETRSPRSNSQSQTEEDLNSPSSRSNIGRDTPTDDFSKLRIAIK